ncbi:MAG: glycosyltransferase [Armatimonadetes bacterium]|nr:glycosyltransferase [Armatimonadota bacterium]
MIISVLVPTYRRTQDLARCLEALKKQLRPVDEVIVVVRDSDEETLQFFRDYQHQPLPLKTATVSVTGVIAAMNEGLGVAQGDVIALTDDDAAPPPDWIGRIEAYILSDERIGGVGGRDIIAGFEGAKTDVGILRWWGRVSGNHHIGVGAPREVDVLKGVNCAYRAAPLRKIGFDTRMRGEGAQVHWELSLGLALKREGWKLIYDPSLTVDHVTAQRHDKDQRVFSSAAHLDIVHNETLVLLDHFIWPQRVVFLIWAVIVGSGGVPGGLQFLRLMARRDSKALQKFRASFSGRMAGLRSFLNESKGRKRLQ